MMTRDPIKEIKWMRLGDLIHNSRNWKTHPQKQKDALVGAVDELGFGDVVKAYVSERAGGVVLLDGHGRKEAMPDLQVRVAIMDYDDAEADLYLAEFDSVGHLAETDSEMWSDLMSDTQTASEVLQGVLDEMGVKFGAGEEADYDNLWEGMPEFEQEDLSPEYTIKVHFASIGDRENFAELIGQKIGDKTKSIWYPKAEKIDMKSELYRDES